MRPTGVGDRSAASPEPAQPTVVIEDRQNDETIDGERWAELARQVLVASDVHGPAELVITFVDEAEITELNQTHMDSEGATDVLSFPIDGEEDADWTVAPEAGIAGIPRLLGDIVICAAVAARNAPDHAGTLDDELALLVVHGILHLLGHDHVDPGEATEMRDRESELLGAFHGNVAVGTEIPDVQSGTGPV